VALASGIHRLGPDNASLQVKTYREGMAAKVGHDLVIEVTRWEAAVDLTDWTVELNADARSLEVREGLRGLKPLTDKERSEIRKNIDDRRRCSAEPAGPHCARALTTRSGRAVATRAHALSYVVGCGRDAARRLRVAGEQ
jgi:hypothetical protein